MDLSQLHKYALVYQFGSVKLCRHPGTDNWFISDQFGFRLAESGFFVGCPEIARMSDWIEDTTFGFERALEVLALSPEAKPHLPAFFVYVSSDRPR